MINEQQRVLVVGVGVTGLPLIEFLHKKKALITITDSKSESDLTDILKKVKHIPFKKVLGGHPRDINVYGNPDIIIVSPGVPLNLPFLLTFRELKVPVIGEIELAFQYMNSPVIAITGTNGKTTTTALTGEIFRLDGKNPEIVGNIGIPAISKAEITKKSLYFIMEVSSFQLETIRSFRPKAAALLNITPDHLNRHGSFENYVSLKLSIFKNQTKNDIAVINADDYFCVKHASQLAAQKCLFSRFQPQKNGIFVDDKGNIIFRWKDEQSYVLNITDIRIPGSHNVENAMAAAGLALTSDISLEAVREGLRTFNGVEHRIEPVASINGVQYVNDSKATNPDAAIKAIEAIDAPILLLAGGMDKKSDFMPFFKSFNGKVIRMYVYGETASQLQKTAEDMSFFPIERVKDLEEGVFLAEKHAVKGSTVLLSPACASWDMYSSFEERGMHFKKIVEEMKHKNVL